MAPWIFINANDWNALIANVNYITSCQKQILAAIAKIPGTTSLGDINTKLDQLLKQEQQLMVDTATIETSLSNLTAQVEAAKGVEQSGVVAIQGLAAKTAELAAEIASLTAGTVTQAQIDDLAARVQAQADATTNAAAPLAAAIAANPV